MNLTISQLKDIKKSLNVNYKQDHQKYAERARIFAEIHCACENLCNSRIQNPGKIPEESRKNPGKTNKPSRTIPEDYWVYWKNPGRIPEESRKNKQDHQKYAVRVKIFAEIRRACENLCNSRIQNPGKIPEESRKNPGKTNKPSRTIPEDYWVYWKNPGRIPEESRKNKQDRRTIPEESRKTIGSIRRIPEESRKNFRIPEKSRKNTGT